MCMYVNEKHFQGIDLAKAIPFDAKKLIEDAKQGATIDETTGSVKNLNQQAINKALEDYQAKVKTYLEQNHPKATVGDVLGTDKINPYRSTMLAPMLPYKVNTVIADYQALPDNMKHYFVLKTYASTDNGIFGVRYPSYSSPIMNVKIPTTQLQGKALSFSFKPANEAEEKKLLSLLPKDEKGTLPSRLPTNISMTPELSLGDEVLGSGGSYRLGTAMNIHYGLQNPHNTDALKKDKEIIVGEYHAIGYNMQGMGQKQLESTKAKLEKVKTKLEDYQKNKDKVVLEGLTKHDLTGAMLQANVQSYFALGQSQDEITAKQSNIIIFPQMSYGTFSTTLNTRY